MYLRVPRYQEEEGSATLARMVGGTVIVEEKVDGKLCDGASTALVEMEGYEVYFFGEQVAHLDAAHVLIYREPPSAKLVFDVAVRVGGRLAYLDAGRAALATLLMGYVFVPVIDRIENFSLSTEALVSSYIGVRSRFKSVLNPRYCKEHEGICGEFYSKYGERPSEGFIVKQYVGGELLAVKFVKDEFEEMINNMGRHPRYLEENRYVRPLSPEEHADYWRDVLTKTIGDDVSKVWRLIARSYRYYLGNYSVLESQRAWRNLDEHQREYATRVVLGQASGYGRATIS